MCTPGHHAHTWAHYAHMATTQGASASSCASYAHLGALCANDGKPTCLLIIIFKTNINTSENITNQILDHHQMPTKNTSKILMFYHEPSPHT
jgi:hypothetical protein